MPPLRGCVSLTSLALVRCRLDQAADEALGDFLSSPDCRLRVLQVSLNIGLRGARHIMAAAEFSCLETLAVRNVGTCSAQPDALRSLFRARHLTRLDLRQLALDANMVQDTNWMRELEDAMW